MTRKRYLWGEYPTKAKAQEEGRRRVGLTYVQKLGSTIKKYEVKKSKNGWKLYLIEKTTKEVLTGKLR